MTKLVSYEVFMSLAQRDVLMNGMRAKCKLSLLRAWPSVCFRRPKVIGRNVIHRCLPRICMQEERNSVNVGGAVAHTRSVIEAVKRNTSVALRV